MTLRGKRVVLLGATSGIARWVARELASRGARLHLAGRDTEELSRQVADLSVRYGAEVSRSRFEATDYAHHPELLRAASRSLGGLDGVMVFVGLLGDQERAQRDFDHAREIAEVNYLAVASLLTHAANLLEPQGEGFLVAISSVAGDRGRRSNYVYGSAKGALSVFMQGLRHRLAPAGIRVVTVKPGTVDTKMTFGMQGLPLMASPQRVGAAIVRGLEAGRETLYVPWYWGPIMAVLRLLPEGLFQRLKL